ncbi:MAG TPA: DegT/DnrJ/EryC1/StrS family aminotransferase [Pseudolabrys sp.]|nr:DegT/DnrJ/EryC1/StrS family aminotransferase [Pseudolabrys sp.]
MIAHTIPWASPAAQYRAHKADIQAAIARVLDSGAYVLGGEVESFERAFADYCGVAHAVGVGSGTDALILALRGLDIGEGDEVVTVSHTALATVAAIVATGATPVLVDIDAASYTIDPARLEEAIGPRTKAIIAVHLYGRPADLDAIGPIAKRHKLHLIEDCAQATGARYREGRVGSVGDVACFSFYPTKNLGAIGDGGMVTTREAGVAARVRRLRQYGWNDARETEEVGVNSRLDPLQAAILRVKLPHLDDDNARRAAIARRYGRGLAGLPLTLPTEANAAGHVYHLYVLGCDDRDGLAAHLAKQGVGSAIHYAVPAHRHKGYDTRVRVPQAGLPVTEKLVGRILSLPIYPELSDAEADQVIAAIRGYFSA